MSLQLYNPASDGLPAKAWECLRRNKAFLSDFSLEGAASDEDARDMAEEFRAQMASHPFYAAVFEHLRGCVWHDPEDKNDAASIECLFDICTPWSKLHSLVQGAIEDAFVRRNTRAVETPPYWELDPRGRRFSRKRSDQFLASIAPQLEGHRLVQIPRTVWDNAHKKALVAQMSELLGKPLAKNTHWLKNSGRTLGTKSQWRAYLLVENWRREACGGFALRKAASLAAFEIYANDSFGASPEQRRTAASEFLRISPKLHRHASDVEKQFQEIEKAIVSVYPVFEPLRPR